MVTKFIQWDISGNEFVDKLLESINQIESIDIISNLILDYSKSITNSELGYVGYIDAKTGNLVVPTEPENFFDGNGFSDKNIVFAHYNGLWGWVLKNKRPLLVNNFDTVHDIRDMIIAAGIRSFLSVPVLLNGKLTGQISVANSNRDYSEKDQTLLERFAMIYAIAIQIIQTKEELKKTIEAHDEIKRTLNTFLEFSYIISNEISETALLKHCTCTLKEYFNPDAIIVLLLDDKRNIVQVPIAEPDSCADKVLRSELFQNPNLCRVIRTRQKFVVNDIEKDPQCECYVGQLGIGGYAGFPLITNGMNLGMIILLNKEKAYWNEERVNLLSSVINLSASSLYKLRFMNAAINQGYSDSRPQGS